MSFITFSDTQSWREQEWQYIPGTGSRSSVSINSTLLSHVYSVSPLSQGWWYWGLWDEHPQTISITNQFVGNLYFDLKAWKHINHDVHFARWTVGCLHAPSLFSLFSGYFWSAIIFPLLPVFYGNVWKQRTCSIVWMKVFFSVLDAFVHLQLSVEKCCKIGEW